MMQSMLTTTDNPYDPFDDYDNWFSYDQSHGYNSTGYLARLVTTSSELSQQVQSSDIEQAIDEIVELNVNGLYKKVQRDVQVV